jgi:hypothetical protein
LEVAVQIDIDGGLIHVPQPAILVRETMEGQPAQLQSRARSIVKAEKLVALPRRKRCGQAVP